jgi:hypothetical protein
MKSATFKTTGLLLFTMLFSLSAVMAQPVFIPKVGFNTSSTKNNPDSLGSNSFGGWQIGMDARIGKLIHIVPGIYYFKTGTTLLSQPNTKLTYGMIKTPIKLGINIIPLGGIFRLRVNGGWVPTFNLSGSDANYPHNGYTNGFLAGGGIDVLFMTLDLNYEWGSPAFFKNSDASAMNVFTVDVGFKIKGRKNKN